MITVRETVVHIPPCTKSSTNLLTERYINYLAFVRRRVVYVKL